jgi:hypothetical protein
MALNQLLITALPVSKVKLNWRVANCGGKLIHGSKDCIFIETTEKYFYVPVSSSQRMLTMKQILCCLKLYLLKNCIWIIVERLGKSNIGVVYYRKV